MSASVCKNTCSFSGFRCVNRFGSPVTDLCTSFYDVCEDGYPSTPIPIVEGKYCLNGNAVFTSQCPGFSGSDTCNFLGIRCVDPYGVPVTDECSSFYVTCCDGNVLPVTPVPAGAMCFNNGFVLIVPSVRTMSAAASLENTRLPSLWKRTSAASTPISFPRRCASPLSITPNVTSVEFAAPTKPVMRLDPTARITS